MKWTSATHYFVWTTKRTGNHHGERFYFKLGRNSHKQHTRKQSWKM